MAGRVGVLGKVLLVLVVLVVVLVGTCVWLVLKRPLWVHARMSRFALGAVGLSSSTLDGPAGPMTVWEGGAGPPMVLLHGAGDQAGAWARVCRPLVAEYRLVIPDLPGHWDSEPRDGPLSVRVILEGVERVMDARCPEEPVIMVGNSLGAWLAMLYAREHPDRVQRLVAINGGALMGTNAEVSLFPKTRDEAREMMKALTGPASPPVPGFVLDDIVRQTKNGPIARLAQTASEMAGYVLDGRLDEVTVPVDLVWGEADGLMTLDYARRLLDGLPAARLHTVAGCGHVPHRECPGRLLAVLQEALAQPAPEPMAAPTEPGGEEGP